MPFGSERTRFKIPFPTVPVGAKGKAYLRDRFPWAYPAQIDTFCQHLQLRESASWPPETRDRLVFPIENPLTGELESYVARSMDADSYYRYYNPGAKGGPDGVLYMTAPTEDRLGVALPSGQYLHFIVEGVFDCIPIIEAGYYVTATLGSYLHPAQLWRLREVGCDHESFVVLYDQDKLHECARVQRKLCSITSERVVIGTDLLPEGKDPGACTPAEIQRIVDQLQTEVLGG